MSTIPQQLDWVSKRIACNVGQVFDELCAGIEDDVAAYNTAKNLGTDTQFAVSHTSVGNSVVIAQQGATMLPRIVVKIGIVGETIGVQDGAAKNVTWHVRIGLNDEGRCTLRLEDETQLEQWQFRKKALENLFFGV